jgi:sodium transport system ATP-binding protein
MQEVAALCDRVIIVANGKLAAQGTPEELCDLAGEKLLEDAFVKLIGSDEGVAA